MALLEIKDEQLLFDGLKVALVTTLSDTLDSVVAKRKLVTGTFAEETRSANNSFVVTGLAGTTLLVVGINVTAISTTGSVYMVLQHLLPVSGLYSDLARFDFSTTATKIITIKAEPETGNTADRSNLRIASGTVIDRPWQDSIQLVVGSTNWGGGTVTYEAKYYAL